TDSCTFDFVYNFYEDYSDRNDSRETNQVVEPVTFTFDGHWSYLTAVLLALNIGICLLGMCGNGVVIWISGFKMRRSINSTWYLSLAVSDFVFCTLLPFNITNMATSNWPFGLAMCKVSSFVLFLNMFSSILLLVAVSIDRCLIVSFPVWALNHRTTRKASAVVLTAWVISAALSMPALVYRQVKSQGSATVCYTNYAGAHRAVALSRFVCGFFLPLLVIFTCYSFIIAKLKDKRIMNSSRPFLVMSALIATFFLCWTPYHTFVLLELHLEGVSSGVIHTGLEIGSTLAAANSFLNPILYVLLGNDFRKKLKRSMFQRIENAIAEEGHSRSPGLSRLASVEQGRVMLSGV
uniref:Chemerin chemokine-like receptor 1 n=1 Tax=Scleropages formosus TaxID=113540 RepID=A0A8C9V4Q1_SCLFO